jgi:hypothetical protein
MRSTHVFVNCPFDPTYKGLFNAIVFAVFDLGFVPRCALEIDDASQIRFDKISGIIEECRYGIHDLSYVRLDPGTRLPRFNMPLELGLFLGCKKFGGRHQRTKTCLVLDRRPHRYKKFISDISGHDIQSHKGTTKAAISKVRNWLQTSSRRDGLPGGAEVFWTIPPLRPASA